MKYRSLSDVLSRVLSFTNKHHIEANILIYTFEELRYESESQDAYWASFGKLGGTYLLFGGEENSLRYVGKSADDTGGRVFQWLFKDETKFEQSFSNDDLILIFSYPEQSYMAPALESYIIAEFSPPKNKQK